MAPEPTTSACVARELDQVGGDVGALGEAAVDAADPAGSHEADPGEPADGERAADGGRADRALRGAGGEVARPGLARVRARLAEPLELPAVEPDDDRAVEHADRCRHGRSGPDRAPPRRARPPPPPREGTRARRSSSRARRRGRRRGELVALPARFVRDPSRSSRYRSQLRDAACRRLERRARSRRRGSPRPARRRRRSCPTTSPGTGSRSSTSPPATTVTPRRPRFTTAVPAEGVGAADELPLRLVPEDDVGRELLRAARGSAPARTRGSRSTTRGRR